jgi:hypothetical protein
VIWALKKIQAWRRNVFVSITYLQLRERARIAGVMDVETSCLFFGLCGKPLLQRFAGALARRSGLAPNLALGELKVDT